MKLISTASPHWQADCYNSAEKGESFYILNLKPDDIDFLCGLVFKFPRPKIWSENAFYFNPPATVILHTQSIYGVKPAQGECVAN